MEHAQAVPLPEHGEVGNGRSRCDNITPTNRGTQADYLLRRLARERPDVHQRAQCLHLQLSAQKFFAPLQKGDDTTVKDLPWMVKEFPCSHDPAEQVALVHLTSAS